MVFYFADDDFDNPAPDGFVDEDLYEERCQNEWDENGNRMEDICGGKVWSTGGHAYYNGSYQCYTMYLHCEKCGDYEVECV